MEKSARPHHDETETNPISRAFYSAFVLGRPGDTREEPVRWTQAMNAAYEMDGHEEYVIRFCENQQVSRAVKSGLIKDPSKAICYLSFPPVFTTQVALDPPSSVLLYGRSVDVTFFGLDNWTLDCTNYFPDEHYEDGYVTNVWQFDVEFGMELKERRHLRVGEKLRTLCKTRPVREGGMLARDIFMDVRNEMTPEYATSAYHLCTWSATGGFAAVDPFRPSIEHMGILYSLLNSVKLGWSFKSYDLEFSPRPPALNLMVQNPRDIFVRRFNGLYLGANWGSRYHHTPDRVPHENIGAEIIPPTHEEIAHMMIRYGMDRYRMPDTFEQSKYVYGDEARAYPPTNCVLPAKVFVPFEEALKEIEDAREEKKEWINELGY